MPNPPDSAEERLHLSSRIKGAAVSGAIMADPRIDIDDRDHNKRGAGSDDTRSPGKWRRRRGYNAEANSDYVAVSWTWNAAQDDDPRSGGYKVETSLKDDFQPSKVRDQVFERIQHYTDAHSGQLKYVWIDQHCIVQKEGPEKTQGMQAMDLVYGLSGHPISLLARRINSEDVRLLADILEGVFITHMTGSAEFRLSPLAVSSSQVLEDAMKLLEAITSDLWWSRAWTFQEKYLSESKMKLLIPHFSDKELEKEKKHKKKVFGTAVGELCVKSIDFHRQVTQLCLACKKERPNLAASADRILGKASNYEILLRDTAPDAQYLTRWSQSPRIIKDIEPRESKFCSDRLAIIANCCQYSIRLDDVKLRRGNHSVSLALLALYLLNGEMIKNEPLDREQKQDCLQKTVSSFIEDESFDGFCPPHSKKPLLFNNGCRFNNVVLTPRGMLTKGHLWKLQLRFQVPIEQFPSRKDDRNPLARQDYVLWRLSQLQHVLELLGYAPIAKELAKFIDKSLHFDDNESFSRWYTRTMAKMVVAAMDAHKPLCLGGILEGDSDFSYKGIFILDDCEEFPVCSEWDTDEDWSGEEDAVGQLESEFGSGSSSDSDSEREHSYGFTIAKPADEPIYVFTSSKPKEEGSRNSYPNDIDKHVSIEIESQGARLEDGYHRPNLVTKRWINGLCFFRGHPRQEVVFPWHPALTNNRGV
uniref:Heterokaryon incompatibility domain-containing protein n=1 Tax=Colletotrichum fructicola (strain Nara gc5) TaxID=1213859 RepID=L2FSY6_COLFN